MSTTNRPVVILGAGINGVALARELVLNGQPVILVDRSDLSAGTTAYSSRLIHGGLRYLEYGEFSLVRESLAERNRLLGLAPQFVHPLQLQIPIGRRTGGWLPAMRRFLGVGGSGRFVERGLWLVRSGLWMYDLYARDRTLPGHSVLRVGNSDAVAVDSARYRWLCQYWDAQVVFPERLVISLLADADDAAREAGTSLEVVTYHQVRTVGDSLEIHTGTGDHRNVTQAIQPAAIINATGPWGDHTLRSLGIDSPQLIGGTKGSHFVTYHPGLRAAIGDCGLYAEADDGRPVFILPLAGGVLVGTTDLPFDGDPAEARATEEELEYLLRLVNQLLPAVELDRKDIALHQAGVRPLPHVADARTASVTRRHWMQLHAGLPVPVFSIIGGKLTTCRSLAEESAETVLQALGHPQSRNSRERFLPGGEGYPSSTAALETVQRDLAGQFRLSVESIESIWALLGTRTATVLAQLHGPAEQLLDQTALPRELARWMIQHEWARRLDDLVERRLMLLFHPQLTRKCLQQLAQLLVDEGHLTSERAGQQVEETVLRLESHFGKRVDPETNSLS